MKVIIFTEGGKEIGFGHITRCIALYQAFEEKGITPKFIVNCDDSISKLLKNKKYLIFNWHKEKNKLFELVKHTDVVIVDSYLAEKSLYDEVSEITNGRIIMIDDYNRLEYPKGIVVNPSIYGDKLHYPNKNGITYLLGKDYIILRKEFWKVPKKKINKEIKNILITFGGMNHSALIKKMVGFLKERFNFNFYVVNATKNRITAKEMLNLMLKADICISGGGQTTYELARVGVPTIGICFAENQRFNLEDWQEKGFIEYIGWYNEDKICDKIALTIEKLNDKNARLSKSRIGQRFVDGKGARRVVDEVFKIWK